VVGAENGTLTFMVGGDASALKAAEHLFGSMGSRWVHCGPAGSGLIAKICNNMILGMTMVAVAEAMNLGVKYGKLGMGSILNVCTGGGEERARGPDKRRTDKNFTFRRRGRQLSVRRFRAEIGRLRDRKFGGARGCTH